jgi:hypothetical protein
MYRTTFLFILGILTDIRDHHNHNKIYDEKALNEIIAIIKTKLGVL